jgi:hypothetical protein
VNRVIETVSFSQDNKVQVFELNIGALGGLVKKKRAFFRCETAINSNSVHTVFCSLFASEPSFNHTM